VTLTILNNFVKAIPLMLSVGWIWGAFLFFWTRERGRRRPSRPPRLKRYPKVTILIPCHNEERTIGATVASLDRLIYPNFEVIAVNDGSKDHTAAVLQELSLSRPWLRTIDLGQNRGKAAALNVALLASQGEFLLCVDADSELHPHAATWLVYHLLQNPRFGAVTGNPRVKNRDSLVGRLQVGEFSATIGVIKRYQQIIGKLFTLSGVIAAYRRDALLEVGLWDTESVTEDIAVSWRLQTKGWDLGYEPRAICDVLMPGTLKGLWRQRLRWAQGGFEVMTAHAGILLKGGNWRLKAMYAEYFFSVAWTFAFLVAVVVNGILYAVHGPAGIDMWFHPLHWGVALVGILGLAQFIPGFSIHGRYERTGSGLVFWAVWYPFVYWILNSAVLIVAVPKVIFGGRKKFGTWVSPDRGGIL
jgi:biofilm PGA synthesis N-glycosyltransferase PgaC